MSRPSWERVEALFEDALAQPPEQWVTYLSTVGEDPETSREVLSLLLAHGGKGRFDSIVDQLRGVQPAAASVLLSDLLDRLRAALAGRYTIEREVGRGGTASVFLARDLKHDRPVAIKVVRPDLTATIGSERFLREIQIAARLQHRNILALFDSGEADGSLYYVMPFVEGESLRDRLEREGQLPIEDALRIAREVAEALAHAHSHDVVHRDIKPENILLAGDHCLVADFGIARAISPAGADTVTKPGIAVGTPAYMSPEQGAGSGELDGRSDLYSLGCVLYEMLAGHPPFTGGTAQEVLARHSLDKVPLLRAARPTVPSRIEWAVNTALAKVPADRFRTATQFKAALVSEAAVPRTRGRLRRLVGPVLAVGLGMVALTMLLRRSVLQGGASLTGGGREPIVVVPFEVRATDPALVDLGQRVATEITDAATQEGLNAIAPPTAAEGNRGRSTDAAAVLRRIVSATRAATLVTGTIYQRGESLDVQARLLHAEDLRPIFALPAERGTVAAAGLPLSAAKERALGAIAYYLAPEARGRDVTLYRPPSSLEVFRLAERAGQVLRGGDGDAAALYRQAFAADTTNLGYVIQVAVLEGLSQEADSILQFVGKRRNRLTRGETLWFDYARARWHSPEEQYRAAMAGYAADPAGWLYDAMLAAWHDNRPEEALRYWRARHTATAFRQDGGGWDGTALQALHALGRFQEVLTLARSAGARQRSYMSINYEGYALARLGRTRELDSLIAASQVEAYPVTAGALMFGSALELGMRHPEEGQRMLQRAAVWLAAQRFEGDEERHRLNVLQWTYYFLGSYPEAEQTAAALSRMEKALGSGGDRQYTWQFQGLVAAQRHDTTTALRIAQQMLAQPPWMRASGAYEASKVFAILGQRERAVALLREALNHGLRYWCCIAEEAEFQSLREYPPFQELVRRKG